MTIYEEKNERTKKLITTTFLTLLKTKDFTKISVRDITENARINRGTFYLHYLDKFDLLEKIEDELLLSFEQKLQQASPAELLPMLVHEETPNFSVDLFEFMADNAEQLKILLGPNNHSIFHLRMRTFFTEQFLIKYEKDLAAIADPTIPKDYLASFAASALLGLIEKWLNNVAPENPKQIAAIYIKIIQFIKNV